MLFFELHLFCFLLYFVLQVNSNTIYQQPPFFQNWDNTSMITSNDDWSKVPGITGYLGTGLTDGSTGIDPATITYINVTTLIEKVTANITTTSVTAGGVIEFQAPVPDPAVGLHGSNTVIAPFLLLHLDCTDFINLTLSLRVRDMDISSDNAIQQFVVLYNLPDIDATLFTPVNGSKIDDASIMSAYTENNLTVSLPNSTWLKSKVRLAFITTNAAGNDETLGIDDIKVTGISIASPSPTPSVTPSVSASPSSTPSPSVSPSQSPSASATPSTSSTPSMSSTPSVTPSSSTFPTPSVSLLPSPSSSNSPSATPSSSQTPSTSTSSLPSSDTTPSVSPSISPSTVAIPPSSTSSTPSASSIPLPSSMPSETPSPSSAINVSSPSSSASSTPITFPSSSPAASPDSPSSSEGDSNKSTSIIIGSVVGGLVVLTAIGGAVAFFALRNKRKTRPTTFEDDL